MKNTKDWNITVVGSGTMGRCIAEFFASNGHQTMLYNRTEKNLQAAMEQVKNNLQTLVDLKEMTAEKMAEALGLLVPTTDLKAGCEFADMIIESVSENVEIKQKVYADIDRYAAPDTVIASNTSTMDIFKTVTISHMERLIITHFFIPAHVMPLVEEVCGEATSKEVIDACKELLVSCGKQVAILNKVIPGFIMNRITTAILREMFYIADQGAASLEDIDKAIVATYGPRFAFEGPGMLGDFVGWDIYQAIQGLILKELSGSTEVSPGINRLCEAGTLGVKTSGGIYPHENPAMDQRVRSAKIIKMISAIKATEEKVEEEMR